MTSNQPVLLEDTTLREGEQTPGVVFTEWQKHEIVASLLAAGINHIEIGIPVMGGQEERSISSLARQFPNATLIGWNRGVKEDLQRAIGTGVRAIHIGLPSSRVHLDQLYAKSHSWVIETATELVEHARTNGIEFISVSAEDMGRADRTFLCEYARALAAAGATRLRLSDTVGCLRPGQVTDIVRAIKQSSTIPLQLHMHNDFGLAVANVLAGLEGGAEQVHTTINGIGERAGIAALHQVVLAIEVLVGRPTGVRCESLAALSELVSKCTGHGIPHNEPVLGSHVFTHESGIHVNGMLQLESSFEPFPPKLVGRSHKFVLGKHSGSQAIVHLLSQAGVLLTREQARVLLPTFRELAIELGGIIPLNVAALVARQLLQLNEQATT